MKHAKESVFQYGDTETNWLKSRDTKLGAVMERIGHIDRAVEPDLYAAIVHDIVAQQISTKAQETIWKRLGESLGEIAPANVITAGREGLQANGISSRKAEYILDFTAKVLSGECDLDAIQKMPDAEAIDALVSLKGIGVWTAEMILLFCLQRPDVLSYGDLGIQRGMRMVYRHRELTPRLFAKYRKRLSPYGSVASLYFWAVSGGAIPELTDPASPSSPKHSTEPQNAN